MSEHNGHGHGPNVPYQAVQMLVGIKAYQDALSEAVRHMRAYSPKELEEKGITKDGKVQGEGLWAYVNHIAEGELGKHGLDAQDPRWKAGFNAISGVVKQFGKKGLTTDLLESVIGQYIQAAVSYVAEKDQQMVATMPTEQGKAATMRIAALTGNDTAYAGWINGAKDPTEVAGIKAQLESELRNKVNTAVATGTIDDLLAKAEHEAHGHGDGGHH